MEVGDKVIINNPISSFNKMKGVIEDVYEDQFKTKPSGKPILLALVAIDFPTAAGSMTIREIFPVDFLIMEEIDNVEFDEDDSIDLSEAVENPYDSLLSEDGKTVPKHISYRGMVPLPMEDATFIDLPDSVITIEDYGFFKYSQLKQINLSNSLETIGYGAFMGCKSLKSLDIPECVKEIADRAFFGCINLNKITCHTPEIYDNLIKQQEVGELPKTTKIKLISEEIDLSESIQRRSGFVLFDDGKKLLIYPHPDYQKLSGHVDIPDGVEIISKNCFRYCNKITSIHLPDSVKKIDEYAFSDCDSLESINIPNGVANISSHIFYNCKSLESIDIANSVIFIDWVAFGNCISLESIDIPESVTWVYGSAFSGCYNLKTIVCHTDRIYDCLEEQQRQGKMPETVSIILDNGEIDLSESTQHSSGLLLSDDGKKIIRRGSYDDIQGHLDIPDGVEIIPDRCFDSCYRITSIHLPDSIKGIGEDAFSWCRYLKSINIPNSVEYIGGSAFFWCRSLESIDIPESVEEIGDRVFRQCRSLKTITCHTLKIYNNLSEQQELEHLPAETEIIYIGEKVDLGEALTNSSKLIRSKDRKVLLKRKEYRNLSGHLDIPDGVEIIQTGCFQYCDKITSIHIPDSVKEIGSYAFSGCNSLKSINLPSSLENIAIETFAGCISLKSIDIPESVKIIERSAFYACESLESITIPNSVEEIEMLVFERCGSLESISIPESVKVLGYHVFGGCGKLETIICDNPKIYEQLIRDQEAGDLPKTVEIIPSMEEIDLSEALTNPPKLIRSKDGRTLMKHLSYRNIAGHLDIPDGVELIPTDCFKNCQNITSVHFPESIKVIGETAFVDCKSLKSINLPDSVKSIGFGAFGNCISLESIKLPASITAIIEDTFVNCKQLQRIDLPDSIKIIEKEAFFNCKSLQSINLPKHLEKIEARVFYGCESLSIVDIPESVKEIDDDTFLECNGLEMIICHTGEIYDNLLEMQEVKEFLKSVKIVLENEEVDLSESYSTENLLEKAKKIIDSYDFDKYKMESSTAEANIVVKNSYKVLEEVNKLLTELFAELKKANETYRSNLEYYRKFRGVYPSDDYLQDLHKIIDSLKSLQSSIKNNINTITSKKPWEYQVSFKSAIDNVIKLIM